MKIYFSSDVVARAISRKLGQCLQQNTGDSILYPTIFKDKIVENAEEPFFLVLVIDVAQKPDRKYYYWRTYQMKVQYFLDDDNQERITELRVMGERLMGILDEIDIEYQKDGDRLLTRPARARKLHYQITENVLNFFCTYKIKVRQDIDAVIKMQILDIQRMED